MSISRSQAEALKDGFLNSIGEEPSHGELPIIDAVLSIAAGEFIETASANLDRANAVSSGTLSSDLTFDQYEEGSTHTLAIGYDRASKGAKYWDFVNKGVQGVGKPGRGGNSPYKFKSRYPSKDHVSAILSWYKKNGTAVAKINNHPVSGIEHKGQKLKASISQAERLQSLAYATAVKIKREGLKATHYFDDAVSSTFGPEFNEAMQVALGGEVILRIRQYNK